MPTIEPNGFATEYSSMKVLPSMLMVNRELQQQQLRGASMSRIPSLKQDELPTDDFLFRAPLPKNHAATQRNVLSPSIVNLQSDEKITNSPMQHFSTRDEFIVHHGKLTYH